jgi:hypothetical protein
LQAKPLRSQAHRLFDGKLASCCDRQWLVWQVFPSTAASRQYTQRHKVTGFAGILDGRERTALLHG